MALEKTAPKKKKRKTATKSRKKKERKISYHRKPDDLTLDQWQVALREQFGKNSKFKLTNIGDHPLFSEFIVSNPETKNEYRVSIHSRDHSANFCSCMDYKTNRLGVCKHLGFALAKLERKRGFKKMFREGYQQPHSSIYLDYRGERTVKMSIGSENTAEFQNLKKQYFDDRGVLTKRGFTNFEKLLAAAEKINPNFRCYEDTFEFVLNERENIKRQNKINRLFKTGLDSKVYDSLLNINLYDYQKQGVRFALSAGRCLLADDMGLGKTVQAIATAEFYKKYYKIRRVVIICPTSLKYQWKHEIERFTKSKAHVVEGHYIKRREQYQNETSLYHILGYRMAANDIDLLNDAEPDLIILDEAQRIKNWKTKTSIAIKKLRSPYAMVLTGTPIENKLEELYSIMQFIDQFKLGPLYKFLDRHLLTDPGNGKVVGYENLKEIGQNLKDVLLRRTKKKVLMQMPKRQDKVLLVPMTVEQRELHDAYSEQVAKLVHKWNRMKFLSEPDRKKLLVNLSKMRMVCDSTHIVDPETRYDTKVLELMCILEEFFANPEEKVVIFSQWSRMLNLVAEELDAREMAYQYLHGGVPSKKREGLLDAFRDDPDCRVFLSTDAGGVGLNLQNASLVVNLDIPWNPAILEQRIARVYRLGQTRPVQVINLVSAHTIEHRMLDVLKFKNAMAVGVLDDGKDAIFMTQSKFSKFMGKIEDLTGGEASSDSETSMQDIQREVEEQNTVPPTTDAPQPFPNDDDLPTTQPTTKTPEPEPQPATTTGSGNSPTGNTEANNDSPQAVVQSGMQFLQGLVTTLQSPEKTQALVKSITEKDEATGKTYLKIPVENEGLVENALKLFGGLFGKR